MSPVGNIRRRSGLDAGSRAYRICSLRPCYFDS